jgi:hypothetical protein
MVLKKFELLMIEVKKQQPRCVSLRKGYFKHTKKYYTIWGKSCMIHT